MEAFRVASSIGLDFFGDMDNFAGDERSKTIDPAVARGGIH